MRNLMISVVLVIIILITIVNAGTMDWGNIVVSFPYIANDSSGWWTSMNDGSGWRPDGWAYGGGLEGIDPGPVNNALDWNPALDPTCPIDSTDTTYFGWYFRTYILKFKMVGGNIVPESIRVWIGPGPNDSSAKFQSSNTLYAWHAPSPLEAQRLDGGLMFSVMQLLLHTDNFKAPGTGIAGPEAQFDEYDSLYVYIEDRWGKFSANKWHGPPDPFCPNADSAQRWSYAISWSSYPGASVDITNPNDQCTYPGIYGGGPPLGVWYLRYYSGGIVDTCIPAEVHETHAKPPKYPVLFENSPNPFNTATDIKFSLPEPAYVKLEVTDVLGKHVITLVDEQKSAGTHTVRWNATDEKQKTVPSGVYFYELKVGDWSDKRKMTLVK